MLTHFHVSSTLFAKLVLIHCNHFFICQNSKCLLVHFTNIITREQRGSKHTPHREMRAILFHRQHTITHLKHVRVVPMSRSGVFVQVGILVNDFYDTASSPIINTFKSIDNVTGSPPKMSDAFCPCPRLAVSPLANREYDRTPGSLQGITHCFVGSLRILAFIKTPVILQIIHSPFRISACILKLIATASRSSGTSQRSRT